MAEYPSVARYQHDLGATLHNIAVQLIDRGELPERRPYSSSGPSPTSKPRSRPIQGSRDTPVPHWALHRSGHDSGAARRDREAAVAAGDLARTMPDSGTAAAEAGATLIRCLGRRRGMSVSRRPNARQPPRAYADQAHTLIHEAERCGADDPESLDRLAVCWRTPRITTFLSRDPSRAIDLAKRAIERRSQVGKYRTTLGLALYARRLELGRRGVGRVDEAPPRRRRYRLVPPGLDSLATRRLASSP